VTVYSILTALPVWATAGILFVITMVAILVGRDVLEGLPYNVSYSAVVGDAGLIISVLIAATVLQRGGCYIPELLQVVKVHELVLVASMALGAAVSVFTLGQRSGQLMDVYHDVIVGPLFLYLAITLLPVVYYNGTRVEKWSVVGFIILWFILVVFDIRYDRMNQRDWLYKKFKIILK